MSMVDALVFQIHCSFCHHRPVVGICEDGDGFMSTEEGPAMASPTSLCFSLLPSSSGTLLFLRRTSLSGMMAALARMHVPGAVRLVRMYGAVGLVELLGSVSL